jgi:hypothetical protein
MKRAPTNIPKASKEVILVQGVDVMSKYTFIDGYGIERPLPPELDTDEEQYHRGVTCGISHVRRRAINRRN